MLVKKLKNKLGFVLLGGMLFALFVGIVSSTPTWAIPKKNWPSANKSAWKMKIMKSSQVTKMVQFSAKSGYYAQGGIITKDHYVFSAFKNDSSTNYIYFANKSGKVVKTIKGNWNHMNSFYYDWDSGHIRIRANSSNKNTDKCYNDATMKAVSLSKCKASRPKQFSVQGLTKQGEATQDGFTYMAASDLGYGGASLGQKFYYQKGYNAVFIYNKSNSELVRTICIPSSVVNGELEDVSINSNGDLYLFYSLGNSRPKAFYRIKKADLGLPPYYTLKAQGKISGDSKTIVWDNLGLKSSTKVIKGSSASVTVDKEKTKDGKTYKFSHWGSSCQPGGVSGYSPKNSGKKCTVDPLNKNIKVYAIYEQKTTSSSSNSNSNSNSNSDPDPTPDPDPDPDPTPDPGSDTTTYSSSPSASTPPQTMVLGNITTVEGVLGLIIDILIIGIPILGVIGITVVGIQYLTAGGDEEKTRKAKRRMFEIVIGLALYAVGFAALKWLGVA